MSRKPDSRTIGKQDKNSYKNNYDINSLQDNYLLTRTITLT